MDSAVRLSPQDPFLRLQKALVLLAQDSPAAAVEEIRAGASLLQAAAVPAGDPRQLLRFLAVNLFRQKRYKEAVFHASKLLRGNYADAPLHVLVAQCCQATGDLGKARNHYERALEVDRDSPEIRQGYMVVLWESGDTRELARQADILLRADPRDEVGRYFAALALSRNGGPVPEVLAGLQALIRSRGPDPVLMTELGSVYLRAGMPELAEGWLERSLKLLGEDAELLARLAGVNAALGRADREADVITRYLQVRPEDSSSRKRLVHLLLEAASWAEASGHISKLLAAAPRNPRLLSLLALCFRRTQRFADALVIFRDLLSVEPLSQEHVKGAVYCLDRMGSRAVARAFLAGYMKEHGEAEPLLLVLGVLFSKDGDTERAAACFRRVLALSPRSWRAYRNLAMIHRRTGNSEFADTFMHRARQYRQEEVQAGAAVKKKEGRPRGRP
jgi:Flp pilus assembly protein TadD